MADRRPSGPQSYSIHGARVPSHSLPNFSPIYPSFHTNAEASRSCRIPFSAELQDPSSPQILDTFSAERQDPSSPYRMGHNHAGYIAAPSVHVLNQQAQHAAAAAQYQASMPARENSCSSTHMPSITPRIGSLATDWQQSFGKLARPMPMSPLTLTGAPFTTANVTTANAMFTPAIVGVRPPSMAPFVFSAFCPEETGSQSSPRISSDRQRSSPNTDMEHNELSCEPKSPGGLSASTVIVGADIEEAVETASEIANRNMDGENEINQLVIQADEDECRSELSQGSLQDSQSNASRLPSLTPQSDPNDVSEWATATEAKRAPSSIEESFGSAERAIDFQSTEATSSSDIAPYLARHGLTSSVADSYKQFNSTWSYPHSVVSEAFLPQQAGVPWCPLSPTAEDEEPLTTSPCAAPPDLQAAPQSDSLAVEPAVLAIGYKGHHMRNESYPCMHHRMSSSQQPDRDMLPPDAEPRSVFAPELGESRTSLRFTHQRNISTSSCPQTESMPPNRRHSAPQVAHKPAWLIAECEKGFRFVAQDTDDMITVSQNKTALTFVFEQLGPEEVPMPKYDTWYTQVFQNFDEDENRAIHFDNFVEIVTQYYEHHTKYRRRRAQHLQQELENVEMRKLVSEVNEVSDSQVFLNDANEVKEQGEKSDADVNHNCVAENSPATAEKGEDRESPADPGTREKKCHEGDVGSEGDECLSAGPPVFPDSKCLLPEKGRVVSISSSGTGVLQDAESGVPVKLSAEFEYPAYAGRLQIFDDYEFQNQAGKGAFGKVIVVKHKRSKAIRACKTIRVQNDLHKTLIDNEIECLQNLNHPNILKLYETYSEGTSSGDDEFFSRNIYLIMELCDGGDLMKRMLSMYSCALPAAQRKKLTENVIARMAQQMLSGIAYCHAQGIIHRDLKPDNILFVDKTEDSDLKIIDFGLASFKKKIIADAKEVKIRRPGMLGKLARVLPGKSGKHIISHHVRKQVMQRAGTAHYMAPEMFRAEYDEKCDLFSIGIILYQLLTGTHPFYENRDDEEKVRLKILSESPVDFPRVAWSAISKEAKDMTGKLLIKNPLKRPSAAEIINSHKWLKDYSKTMHFGKLEDISSSVFEGLNRYQGHNTLKKAVMQLLARELSEFQIQDLRKKFLALDKSGTGTISRNELKEGMMLSGKVLCEQEVKNIMSSLSDDGHGGLIGYNQFVGALIERVSYTRSQLEQVFQKLDTDKSGCITPAKLQSALTAQNITFAEVREIWRDVDPYKNPSAGISFDEFCSLVNSPNASLQSPKMAKI